MPNIIQLRKGEFLRLGREGGRIVQGHAWVTASGLNEDFLLEAGDALPCCHASLLIEALSEELTVESGRIPFRKTA